jgi:hypothetical protein
LAFGSGRPAGGCSVTPTNWKKTSNRFNQPIPTDTIQTAQPDQVMAWLEEGKDVRFGEWNLREVECLNTW